MMSKWQHGFMAHYPDGSSKYFPNAITSAGFERALRLWAGQSVTAWSDIRILNNADEVIATRPTSNSVESLQLRAVATFPKGDVSEAVAGVQLMAGSVVVASANLAAPADQALTVTRIDSLVEA